MKLEIILESMENFDMSVEASLAKFKENLLLKNLNKGILGMLKERLEREAIKFNTCVININNAMAQAERGEISKPEAIATIEPCIKSLKTQCIALYILNGKDSSDDIELSELEIIREFITGTIKVVDELLEDARVCHEDLDPALVSVVTEAFGDVNYLKQVRNSTDAKTAAEYVKQGKSLYGIGDKEAAKGYVHKAIELYEKCIKDTKSRVKMYDEQQEVSYAKKGATYKSTRTKEVTDSRLSSAIDFFEGRIDNCRALLKQWENKAGNIDFKATKKNLKDERKDAKRKKHLAASEGLIEEIDSAVESFF